MFDYESLRVIWWLLLGVLLIGYAIMDGFDLGVAILLPATAKTDLERRVVINTIGPVWEGNQVWFILGGGAIFAAWPLLYGLSFSGFYLALLVVLMAFIVRPVAYKFRSKLASAKWRRNWDMAIFGSGLVPALIFGVAVGNVLQGVPFYFDETLRPIYTGSFFGLLNPFACLCGALSISMLVQQGGLYLGIKTVGPIQDRAAAYVKLAAVLTMVIFIAAGIWLAYGVPGYHLTSVVAHDAPSNPLHKQVASQLGDWFVNYRVHPLWMAAPACGILGGILVLMLVAARSFRTAIVVSSVQLAGIIGAVGLSMFPFILPSSTQPAASLLVWDASSSQTTLGIMLVSTIIFLPIILMYTSWVYYIMRGKVTPTTIEQASHDFY